MAFLGLSLHQNSLSEFNNLPVFSLSIIIIIMVMIMIIIIIIMFGKYFQSTFISYHGFFQFSVKYMICAMAQSEPWDIKSHTGVAPSIASSEPVLSHIM